MVSFEDGKKATSLFVVFSLPGSIDLDLSEIKVESTILRM